MIRPHQVWRKKSSTQAIQLTSLLDLLFVMIFVSLIGAKDVSPPAEIVEKPKPVVKEKTPPPPPFSTSTVNETLSLDLNKLALYLSMLPLSTVLYTTLIHNDDRDGTRRLAEEFREQLHVEVVEEESRKNNTVDTCIEINSRPVSAAIINEEEEEEEEEEGEDDDELDALLEISDKHQRSSGNGKVGGGYTSSKGDLTDFLDSL